VIRGNSDIHQSVPEDSKFGATWAANRRRYRRAGARGNSRTGSSAPPKDARIGRLDDPSPVKPEMQDEGKPKSYIRGAAGGKQATGRLGTWLKPAPPKECEVRGDSNLHRRHSRRTEAKGQPEDSDAGSGERERGRGNPETQPGLGGKMQEAGQPATSSAGRTGRCLIH
jgi:hypothetical protein